MKEVLDVLEANGLPAGKLQFELSEAQNLSAAGVDHLNILHDEYGVSLYLANFGKGHSNIDLLTEVHFDGIELDRSFAAMIPENEQACRVVVGIQHLAHTLDLKVCAKGIENQDQFEFFEELDCLKGQGFLIGKPMRMQEMAEYIVSRRDWDFATVEMGINMLGFTEEAFEERVRSFTDILKKDGRPVFATSIFHFNGESQEKATAFRRIVRKYCEDGLHYLDGLQILSNPAHITQDLSHPSTEGVSDIIQNWGAHIRKYL